jgi:hypothetical protein
MQQKIHWQFYAGKSAKREASWLGYGDGPAVVLGVGWLVYFSSKGDLIGPRRYIRVRSMDMTRVKGLTHLDTSRYLMGGWNDLRGERLVEKFILSDNFGGKSPA